VPSFVWRKPVGGNANLRRHVRFEFVVGNLQEREQLSHEHPDIALVDQREA
jgi:hypothetical protein